MYLLGMAEITSGSSFKPNSLKIEVWLRALEAGNAVGPLLALFKNICMSEMAHAKINK